MSDEMTIPLLPCHALEETLDFYRILGFEVTHEQTTPYVYGAVRRGGVELHFYGSKAADSKKLSGTCLVMVSNAQAYHRNFADALRTGFGKVPTAGCPRLSRPREGMTRFSMFDPSNNCLTFIDRDEPEIDYESFEPKGSKLARVIDNAAFLRDTYLNDQAAAQVLDKALARYDDSEPIERARALAARAELAVAMADVQRAQGLRAELQQITLSDEDRERFRKELQAADELERWIG